MVELIAFLILLTAILGFINVKFIKFPEVIGLMALSSLLSIIMMLIHDFYPEGFIFFSEALNKIDFKSLVFDGILSFLLFAGAFHTDLKSLKAEKISITILAIVGVIISTFVAGFGFDVVSTVLGQPAPFLICLLFGALITPSDPIAVLGILKKTGAPKKLQLNIIGESLFNDGTAIVTFTVIYEMAFANQDLAVADILKLFALEAGGGFLFGIFLGYIGFIALRAIDHYETELIITIALVMCGYTAAKYLHISGPLAMVVCGLITGSKSKKLAMTDKTREYLDGFWETADMLLNALLFVLMGLELIVIQHTIGFVLLSLFAIGVILVARFLSIYLPILLFNKWIKFPQKSEFLLTWGGLKGGLSLAMALSIPIGNPNRDLVIFVTYAIVLFSIIVQGLTLEKVILWTKKQMPFDNE